MLKELIVNALSKIGSLGNVPMVGAAPRKKSELPNDVYQIIADEVSAMHQLFIDMNVDAWVVLDEIVVSPAGNFVRYTFDTSAKTKFGAVTSLTSDIERAIRKVRNRLGRDDDRIAIKWDAGDCFDLPFPGETSKLTWASAGDELASLKPFQALLGIDYTAKRPRPTVLDFGSGTATHALVGGKTRSGKTGLIAGMMASLCLSASPDSLQIIFVDPKFDEDYAALALFPHVSVFSELEECAAAISAVHAEFERRKRQPDKARKVILFVDEYADLVGNLPDGGESLNRCMSLLVAGGASKGVHVVLGTQKPLAKIVDTVAKGNLGIRIGGSVKTAKESEIIMGVGGVGCEGLPGKGSFYADLGDGSVRRLQTYFVDNEAIRKAVAITEGRYGSVEAYRIHIDDHAALPDLLDTDDALLAKIDEELDYVDLFDEDGDLVRGARAKVLKVLFGDGAKDANSNRETTSRLLAKIREKSRM